VVKGGREESNFGRNASAPTWTIAVTHHETDRPGSSGAIVPWCSRRPPNGLGPQKRRGGVLAIMTRRNKPPIRYVCRW